MGDYRDRRRKLKQHTFGGADRHSKSSARRRKEEHLDHEHRMGTEGRGKRRVARSDLPTQRLPRTDAPLAGDGPTLGSSHPAAAQALIRRLTEESEESP